MKAINIGPPRVRGRIFQDDLEFGVDPEIIRWLQAPYFYNRKTGEYFRADKPPDKNGKMKLIEIVWHVSPWPEGNA